MMAIRLTKLILIIFAVVMVIACVGPSGIRYQPLTKANYTAGKTPVKMLDYTPATMVADGFVLIGYLERIEPYKVCYAGKPCANIRFQTPLRERLQRQAQRRGAQQATILFRKAGKESVLKEICTSYVRESLGDDSRLATYECDDYKRLRGTRFHHVIRVLLWRYAPDQARSAVNQNAVQQQMLMRGPQ